MSVKGLDRLLKKIPANIDETVSCTLPRQGSWPKAPHRLNRQCLTALVAALGSGRPLLVLGEAGVGKSSLARAAAELTQRHFISTVVQPDSDYQELLWHFDHTERLGRAQLLAHGGVHDGSGEKLSPKDLLAAERFIAPGPLWWAMDYHGDKPTGATGYKPEPVPAAKKGELSRDQNGIVLLVDEIDKADISLCNGLLEALGNGGFSVPLLNQRVPAGKAIPPLLVITSNGTRQLPPAFLRRCVVLRLDLPAEGLEEYLAEVGKVHFPRLTKKVRLLAAEQICEDRAQPNTTARAGQAEYLDLLRTLVAVAPGAKAQRQWLSELGRCFMKSTLHL